VGEILNILIEQLMGRREICGVVLLGGEREKISSQYAHDTTLTLVGNEKNVNKAMNFLNNFLHISRLEFNWGNMVFWYGTSNFKQHWLRKHT
jgi:Ni,Fe-hydrogenase III large subunit